jgi:hypothetical protein
LPLPRIPFLLKYFAESEAINVGNVIRLKFAMVVFEALPCVACLWHLSVFISQVDLVPHLAKLDLFQVFYLFHFDPLPHFGIRTDRAELAFYSQRLWLSEIQKASSINV